MTPEAVVPQVAERNTPSRRGAALPTASRAPTHHHHDEADQQKHAAGQSSPLAGAGVAEDQQEQHLMAQREGNQQLAPAVEAGAEDRQSVRGEHPPTSNRRYAGGGDPLVELTAQGLGNRPAAQQWRNLVAVDTSFYKSFMSEEIRDEGRVEGRAEGLAEGQARGLLLIFEVRGIAVTDQIREKITNCSDPQLLNRWLKHAITASSAEEVFAEE
ncbi:hypothetical protein [Streptomyces brevispora]|uniref:hypothetical protein n=1 Tax=Streptomyces brevispora TaxID=887462 RepID=UPI0035E21A80